MGGAQGPGAAGEDIFKSTDRGSTWIRSGLSLTDDDSVTALAASAATSTIFAGTANGRLHKSTDAGVHWSQVSTYPSTLAQAIASLVVEPGRGGKIYLGTEADYSYYDFRFGYVGRSSDNAATWSYVGTGGASVLAIAIDPLAPSKIYLGLSSDKNPHGLRGVLRSDNSGASWTPAGAGLASVGDVLSLAADPRRPGTVYAGTERGLYRTRDSGASWVPFGQQLQSIGTGFRSLAFSADGRVLHAGTGLGIFELEIREGPADLSPAGGGSRVLVWDAAERLVVRSLDASGAWTSTPAEGPFLAWTATAIAEGADGRSHVLWQNGDSRVGLEIVGAGGSEASIQFPANYGSTAVDVSVGSGGNTHLLWTTAAGAARVSDVDPAGVQTFGPSYGPYDGWRAVAIADGADGATWVLWRHTSGRACVSRFHERAMDSAFRWSAIPGWNAEDLTVGRDGRPRLLWTSPDGRVEIFTVDAAGELVAGQVHENAAFEARRIAAGADGLTRLLWSSAGGSGSVWLLNPDNAVVSQHPIPGEE